MPDNPATFSTYGLLGDDLQPPTGTIRSELTGGRVFGQYLATFILIAVGAAIMALIVWLMPQPMAAVAFAATLSALLAFVYLATRNDYRWVELEGDILRARHLYTGGTIERSVAEIDRLCTLAAPATGALEVAITNKLLGRVRGMEIRFRDKRTPLKVMRADPKMTNAQELIEAILYRMSQIGEIVPEVVDHGGLPLVRNIHWEGDDPGTKPVTPVNVVLACFIGLALMLGLVFAGAGLQEQDKLIVTSRPPHEMSISDLIKNGPGENRHITLTEYLPGGYVLETSNQAKDGHWSNVWVALFPAGQAKEIKVVMSSKSISNLTQLKSILLEGKVTGVCSHTERRSWGTELGPEMVKSNQGAMLTSAWEIEHIGAPPSETVVYGLLYGSYALLAVVIGMSLLVFAKGAFGA